MGMVFLWGVLAPRSQWRALSSWSVSDANKHEPGGAAYGVRRLLSGIGALGIAGVMVASTLSAITFPPAAAPPRGDIEIMWGSPEPQFVQRVVRTIPEPPPGLVEAPILSYQDYLEADKSPEYFLRLDTYSFLGETQMPGLIGNEPDVGFAAIGFADLVVHVRGPLLCIPREALVVETETTVQIAIYFGLPDPKPVAMPEADGDEIVPEVVAPDNVTACAIDASVTGSILIPIDLAAEVGDREVIGIDGRPLAYTPLAGPSR